MYHRYISRKTSPMFNQTPTHRQSPPVSQRYAPLSDVIQRAQKDPSLISAAEEYHLHKAIGSRATLKILAGQQTDWVPKFEGISTKIKRQRSQQAEAAQAKAEQPIQAKLTIGQPNDKYEREADTVADRVVQQINTPATTQQNQPESLQRRLEAEELQSKQDISSLQRSPAPTLQPEAIAGGEASTELTSAINSAKGSGQPLDAGLQESMGQAMGADFSGVRVHSDAESDKLNQSIQAKAFTTGQDVFFRQGEYQPGSRKGQKLIAHELAHVVQQSSESVQQLQKCSWLNKPSNKFLIQRAIAIEAESHSQTWQIQGKIDPQSHWKLIKDTKAALGESDDNKVKVTSDNGNLEFVTEPLNNEEEVNSAFNKMIKTLDALAEKSPVEIDVSNNKGTKTEKICWKKQENYIAYKLKASSKSSGKAEKAKFLPQATIDIPFDSFSKYLEKFDDKNNKKLIGKTFYGTAKYIKENFNSLTSNSSSSSSVSTKKLNGSTEGFLKMVLMALYDAYYFSGKEDPKYAFPTMPRNRFSEMYEAVKRLDTELDNVFDPFIKKIIELRENLANKNDKYKYLFPNKYKADDGELINGSTVEEWLNSIKTPIFMEGDYAEKAEHERKSDLLSPPSGQRTKKEGLGAYDLANDGKIPFFELRDFMSSHSEKKPKTLKEVKSGALELLKIENKLRSKKRKNNDKLNNPRNKKKNKKIK